MPLTSRDPDLYAYTWRVPAELFARARAYVRMHAEGDSITVGDLLCQLVEGLVGQLELSPEDKAWIEGVRSANEKSNRRAKRQLKGDAARRQKLAQKRSYLRRRVAVLAEEVEAVDLATRRLAKSRLAAARAKLKQVEKSIAKYDSRYR